MLFYRLEIQSLPRLLFACQVVAENYTNHFPWRKDLLEISVVQQGKIVYVPACGQTETFDPGKITTILPDFQGEAYSPHGNTHVTVGVAMRYKWQRLDSADLTEQQLYGLIKETGKEFVYLLPFRGITTEQYPGVVSALEKIIWDNRQGDAADQNLCVAEFLQLLSHLSATCMARLLESRRIAGLSSKQQLCQNIKDYVNLHYQEKITLQDLSNKTGFSQNYLCRIFKSIEKITVADYVTLFRLNLARDMIAEGSMTAREIAGTVGISDEFYLSKLFKRHYGMGIRQYRSMLRES